MRVQNQKSGFTLMELIVAVSLMGVMASLAVVKFTNVVEVQRYRAHQRNLVQLKGKLEEFQYKNKSYLSGPEDLAGLNTALGTHIQDDKFTYAYTRPTAATFQIVTDQTALDYACTIQQDDTYPQCSGADLPE